MKKTVIAGFFIFLFSFSAVLVAIMLLIADRQGHLIMAGMENAAPVSMGQKLIFHKLAQEGEDRFLAVGFYVFITGFMVSLFMGKRFLKAVKDLHLAAQRINSGDFSFAGDFFVFAFFEASFSQKPAFGAGEFEEIAAAMNRLSRGLREKEGALALKNLYASRMLDSLWTIDEENNVTDINPAFTELLGYERDDIIGFPVFDFLDEESEKALRKLLLSFKDGASEKNSELTLISKQGDRVAVMVSWSPLPGPAVSPEGKNKTGRETAGWLGMIRDFRDEADCGQKLRDAGEFQQAFMDSIPDIFFLVDERLDIIMSNKAAKDRAEADPAGSPYTAVCGRDGNCATPNCPVRMVFRTGRPQKELIPPEKNQASSLYEATAYPVKNQRGLVKNAAVLIRDITGRKRLGEELERKERELAALLDLLPVIYGSLRGEEVFGPAMKKLVELTGMDGACAFLLDELGVELSGKYHWGPLAAFFREHGTLKIDGKNGACEEILRNAALGNPFLSADISLDSRAEKSILRQTGMRACAAAPMPGKEKINGVLLLFAFSSRQWNPEDEELLARSARMAGLALENIRLYERMRQLYSHLKWKKEKEEQKEQ